MSGATAPPASPRRPQCPKCGAAVERIPRRWIDRFLGLVVALRRYRCRSPSCGWIGNLRSARFHPLEDDRERRYDRRIDEP